MAPKARNTMVIVVAVFGLLGLAPTATWSAPSNDRVDVALEPPGSDSARSLPPAPAATWTPGGATPTSPPSPTRFRANCIVKPSDCGYPDATNTGVPPGTRLIKSGSVTVTQDGAVVQNLDITNGQIVVKADNVTIKNVRIRGCQYYPIDWYGDKYTGLVVMDTEIHSTCAKTTAGISFRNYTAIRVHVHGAADGFKANRNVTIRDSYVHDLAVTPTSHNDGVQTTNGRNVRIENSTFDIGRSGVCIQFGASDSNWTVSGNLFHCGGWAINGGARTRDSSFTNNRFARVAGWYGPVALGGNPGITWLNNHYDDTGATIRR